VCRADAERLRERFSDRRCATFWHLPHVIELAPRADAQSISRLARTWLVRRRLLRRGLAAFGGSVATHPLVVEQLAGLADIPVRYLAWEQVAKSRRHPDLGA
jgi:hypothetical protein